MAVLDSPSLPARFTDTSEFQGSVYTDAYGHRWASFRCMDGPGYVDHKFAANLDWCVAAYLAGRIEGYYVYFVYRTQGAATLFNAWAAQLGAKIPPGCVLCPDVESWGGSISGDHSADLNTLYGMLAGYAGSFNRVIGYGNEGDLNGIWPARDQRCRVLVASYGDQWTYKRVSGAFGQQYTDGQAKYGYPAGWPITSDPFGACDHNGTPDYTALQLAALHGVQRGPTPSEDSDMSFRIIQNVDDPAVGIYAVNYAGMWWHIPDWNWLSAVWTLPGCENPGQSQGINGAQWTAWKSMADSAVNGPLGQVSSILSAVTAAQQKPGQPGSPVLDPAQLDKAVSDAVGAALAGFAMSGTVALQKTGASA